MGQLKAGHAAAISDYFDHQLAGFVVEMPVFSHLSHPLLQLLNQSRACRFVAVTVK
jgi:hypothetical protein